MSDNRIKRRAPKTAFKKGQSGNPGGRPRSNILKLMSEYAFRKAPNSDKTYGELLVMSMFKHAIEGDKDARKEIVDRLEGKQAQAVDMSSAGAPVKFTLAIGEGDA